MGAWEGEAATSVVSRASLSQGTNGRGWRLEDKGSGRARGGPGMSHHLWGDWLSCVHSWLGSGQ